MQDSFLCTHSRDYGGLNSNVGLGCPPRLCFPLGVLAGGLDEAEEFFNALGSKTRSSAFSFFNAVPDLSAGQIH